jgi:MFS family permease
MPVSTRLRQQPDFLRFWAGQSLGSLCSNITILALPILAVTSLHASAFEMGLLGLSATLPNLLFSLVAGVVSDRVRRRWILVMAEIGRGLVLLFVPLAAVLDRLDLWLLFLILFLSGVCTTFYDVADNSYLPALVGVDNLVRANSALVGSTSVTAAVGPGLAGILIQLLTAPIAIVVDAISSFVAAALVLRIRIQEPAPGAGLAQERAWRQVVMGVRLLWVDPVLRSFVMSSTVYLLFSSTTMAVYVLYTTDELGVAAGTLGLIFGAGGVGALCGAALAEPLARRFGAGTAMIASNLLGGLSMVLIPLANQGVYAVPILVFAQFGSQSMGGAFAIIQTSLRQARTPGHALGRMNASYRFLTMGAIPVGMFMGGLLGETVGLRATVLVGGVGVLLPTAILFLSPARSVRIDASDVRSPGNGREGVAERPAGDRVG